MVAEKSLGLAFLLSAVAFASPVAAQETFDLTLELVNPTPTCSATVGDVDFGQLNAGQSIVSAPLPTVGFNINVTCSSSVPSGTATFDNGLNESGGTRALAEAGGADVDYTLTQLGVGTIGLDGTVSFSVLSGEETIPLQAYLNAQTLPSTAAFYSDQVTVTFTF